MGRREYKRLSCRELGMDCDFLVRATTEEETIRLATEHACQDHKICQITPEFKDKVRSQMQSVWCDREKCGQAQWEAEARYYWG